MNKTCRLLLDKKYHVKCQKIQALTVQLFRISLHKKNRQTMSVNIYKQLPIFKACSSGVPRGSGSTF